MRQTTLGSFFTPPADGYAGVQCVTSGGQTGADRVALETAEALGIATGGWAPPQFYTSAGRAPELGTRFGLRAMATDRTGSAAAAYVARTKANVRDADATLVFAVRPSPGTLLTMRYAEEHAVPLLVVSALEDTVREATRVRTFLTEFRPRTLNVAGHRASPLNGPGYEPAVRAILEASLRPDRDSHVGLKEEQ